MSEPKWWKEPLLRSGLPLEASVAAILAEQGLIVHGEHEFAVQDGKDTRVMRSIDVAASLNTPVLPLRLFIECKYRREGVKWVFLPESRKAHGTSEWVTHCLVPPFVPPWYVEDSVLLPPVLQLGRRPVEAQRFSLPVGIKGVQIIPSSKGTDDDTSSNAETPIRNGINQLRYAVMNGQYGFHPVPREELTRFLQSGVVQFTIPLLVTTAELFLFRNDVGVDEIKASRSIEDVVIKTHALIFRSRPGRELREYDLRCLKEEVSRLTSVSGDTQDSAARIHRVFAPLQSGGSSFADLHCGQAAVRVVIVTLPHLRTLLEQWKVLFSDPAHLEPDAGSTMLSLGGIIYDVDARFMRVSRAERRRARRARRSSAAAHREGEST